MHIFYWWDLWTRRKRIEEGENENRWSISLSLKSKKAVKQNKLNYFESLFQSEEKNIFRKKTAHLFIYGRFFASETTTQTPNDWVNNCATLNVCWTWDEDIYFLNQMKVDYKFYVYV